MVSKARDFRTTGRIPSPPWQLNEPCPCGSGRVHAECCRDLNGFIYKPPEPLWPPPPLTGFAHAKCYMRQFNDCCQEVSGEHSISVAVLRAIGSEGIAVTGAPWVKADTSKHVP